jgi:hypothetical protein
MDTFSCLITLTFKQDHRNVGADFTAVMLGNSHMPWVLDRLRAVWPEVRRQHGVGPIRWFAYPTSVLYVERAGVRVGPDIEYFGYLSDRVLHEHLCAADLAIIPFNIADEPEYGYARYSIPSRLTEFLNAGLPVFAAAGRAPRRIVSSDITESAAAARSQMPNASRPICWISYGYGRAALARAGRPKLRDPALQHQSLPAAAAWPHQRVTQFDFDRARRTAA